MAYWSIRDSSRVADELYIKRGLFGIGRFHSLLSLWVHLYSEATGNFETVAKFWLA